MRKNNLALSGLLSLCLFSGCAGNNTKSFPMIECRRGRYEDYSVKAIIYGQKGSKNSDEEVMRSVEIFDYDDGKLIAEVGGKTGLGSKSPFFLYQNNKIPEGHPFSKYTPEKLEEIFHSAIRK